MALDGDNTLSPSPREGEADLLTFRPIFLSGAKRHTKWYLPASLSKILHSEFFILNCHFPLDPASLMVLYFIQYKKSNEREE